MTGPVHHKLVDRRAVFARPRGEGRFVAGRKRPAEYRGTAAPEGFCSSSGHDQDSDDCDQDSDDCDNVGDLLADEFQSNPADFYVMIKTTDFPNGAIRGQLGPSTG